MMARVMISDVGETTRGKCFLETDDNLVSSSDFEGEKPMSAVNSLEFTRA